jgi:threonine dehydratase
MTEQRRCVANSVQRRPKRAGVRNALTKLGRILPPTPLLDLDIDGRIIWCKAECLQPIGAFKIRGAWHRLTELDEGQRAAGVVAFSSGNHAQGVAWAARRLGIRAAIVMPSDAPQAKLEATRNLGAEIILYDRDKESREGIAAALAGERGATLVPSFADPWIIEGQGSAALELERQMRARTGAGPTQLVVPCGGGGLSAGCALALPGVPIIIVEPEGWDDMARSLSLGRIVPVRDDAPFTSCDALQTKLVSPLTFDVLLAARAKSVTVTEREVGAAMRLAFERLHVVVEPGGAVALAAVLAGKVDHQPGTAILLSGGNVDIDRFAAMVGNG